MAEPLEFLDANVLIRHFAQGEPDHGPRATAYLAAVGRQQIEARMSEASVAEVVYVLTSPRTYRLARPTVVEGLRAVLSFQSLTVPHKSAVLRALDIWETTNIDFEDALNVAHMERLGIATIVSFDRHYDRVPTVTRREP